MQKNSRERRNFSDWQSRGTVIAAKSPGGEDSVYLGCDTVSLHVQFQTLKKELV
jgi:hypothetical protein